MKIQFTLKDTTGSALFAHFQVAINEEGVGYESDFNSSARLSEDGCAWTTSWSGFTYTIVNPTAVDPAVVEYEGAWRGFLTQNLIPKELRGETNYAVVTGGSALEKHSVDEFVHHDARTLAEAYGLMQAAAKGYPGRDNPFGAAIAAIEAAKEISSYMAEIGIKDDASWCRADPGTGSGGSQRNDGDPAVFLTCCPGGRQIRTEFQLSLTTQYVERDRLQVVRQAKAWLDRLRPTFDIAA